MRIETRSIPLVEVSPYRSVRGEDVDSLGVLMDEAYRGTIDWEGETLEQCIEEMSGTLSGKYGPFLDFASFLIFEPAEGSRASRVLAASLVTLWKEKPLLAFSMTVPSARGRGYGGYLIERSISALAERGYPEFCLVVTVGNLAAERLYERLGFVNLGPSVHQKPPPENR